MSLKGIARPHGRSMKAAFAELHPERGYSPHVERGMSGPTISLDTAINETVAVNALAELLERKLASATSSDGRIDFRVYAAGVMRELWRNQR